MWVCDIMARVSVVYVICHMSDLLNRYTVYITIVITVGGCTYIQIYQNDFFYCGL